MRRILQTRIKYVYMNGISSCIIIYGMYLVQEFFVKIARVARIVFVVIIYSRFVLSSKAVIYICIYSIAIMVDVIIPLPGLVADRERRSEFSSICSPHYHRSSFLLLRSKSLMCCPTAIYLGMRDARPVGTLSNSEPAVFVRPMFR